MEIRWDWIFCFNLFCSGLKFGKGMFIWSLVYLLCAAVALGYHKQYYKSVRKE